MTVGRNRHRLARMRFQDVTVQAMLLVAAAGLCAAGCEPPAARPPASPAGEVVPPFGHDAAASSARLAGPSVATPAPGYRPGYAASAVTPSPDIADALRESGARDLECPANRVKVGYIWGSHLLADGCGRRAVYMKDGTYIYLLSIVPLKGEPPPAP
jgi:hypothetical protein